MDSKSKKTDNIYLQSRNRAGMSREDALNFLPCGYDVLQKYETGKIRPSDDMVFHMAMVYNDPFLIIEHNLTSPSGKFMAKVFGLDITRDDLQAVTLKYMKEVDEMTPLISDFVKIACDGMISDNERPRAEQFGREVKDVIRQGASLMYLIEFDNKYNQTARAGAVRQLYAEIMG